MTEWSQTTVAPCGTHHLLAGQPLYTQRFGSVLKYHAPGLAPVCDESGAYHIDPQGRPVYSARFCRTFGFYEGRAAVTAQDGRWLHILPDGEPLSAERYRFCGNFQEGRCVVRDEDGRSFHIRREGGPAYSARYRYVGDYRDGCAVAQRDDGLHGHIDLDGNPVHARWFLDLDVFHKGLARARDEQGWHHVNRAGSPIYAHRFATVEPFYNGIARVETQPGALLLVNEQGETLQELRPARQSALASLSSDLVGFWRTQAVRAAVELGFFEALPGSVDGVAQRCGVPAEKTKRLSRALQELGLVSVRERELRPTARGELLRSDHPLTLAPAALLWAGEHYQAWTGLTGSLRDGIPAPQRLFGAGWFDHIAQEEETLRGYHRALASYARHDYEALPAALDLNTHRQVVDAGGSSGVLLRILLQAAPWLRGVLLDRPEVTRLFHAPPELSDRCQAVAADLLAPWPVGGDAVILARVLHDFSDEAAGLLLQKARGALHPGGRLYIVEMILPSEGGQGGLLDLNMLVMTGGRERTLDDFRLLLHESGLVMREVRHLPAVSSVIVAEAR